MVYKRIAVVFVVLFFAVLLFWFLGRESYFPDMPVQNFSIEGKNLRVFVATSSIQRQQGLMFVKHVPRHIDGMLFVFPDAAVQSFWNKNTFLDLDMLWIRDTAVVKKTFLPAVQKNGLVIQSSDVSVNRVLELFQRSYAMHTVF